MPLAGFTQAQGDNRYGRAKRYADLPKDWDLVSTAALKAAIANTGPFNVCVDGDSIAAGQAGGTQTDALLYGWVGRLETLLIALIGKAGWNGYTIAGCNPGGLTAPSQPYTANSTKTVYDGGVGQVWAFTPTSAADLAISIPNHRITGQKPTSVDLYTVDWNAGWTWQWNIDGGAATTVTTTGGSGSLGAGVLRKTTVTLDGAGPHTINVGTQSNTNALFFAGHVVNYAAAGLGLWRNGIQGFRAVDFMTGPSANGSSLANAGSGSGGPINPDHIQPYSGQTDANNTVGSGFPAFHLTVLAAGLNDANYKAKLSVYDYYFFLRVKAARRAVAGASVLLKEQANPSVYADGGASNGASYLYPQYKAVKRRAAAHLSCAYLDIDSLFGQTPVADGNLATNDLHPTSNGAGAGGGDGHLLDAQTTYALITMGLS